MMSKMDKLMRMHKEDYGELKAFFETISERLDTMATPHLDDL